MIRKRILSTILAMLATMSLILPAFAEDASPHVITRVYKIENVVSLGEKVYGNRILLVSGSGNSDGQISGQISEEFGLESNVSLSSEILESFAIEVGTTANYTKTITRGSVLDVPAGKTGYIWYRKKGNAYQADIVWYQGGTGLPLKEVSRSSAILYQPTSVQFEWSVV